MRNRSRLAISADRTLVPARGSVPFVRLPISRPSPSSLTDNQTYLSSTISSNSSNTTAISSTGSGRSENGYSQENTRVPRVSVNVNTGVTSDQKQTGFRSRIGVLTSGQAPEDPSTTTSELRSPASALVSPSLTCSSRTPSTLSPATPFVGGFGSAHDAAIEVVNGDGHDAEDGVDRAFGVAPPQGK